MSDTTLTTAPPEDRLDLLRAELRVWIDRARPVLEDRLVTGDTLIPYGAALRQVDLIDDLVFGQPALGPDDAERVNLGIMTSRAFSPTPDEEATHLLTNVAGTFRFIDERAWPEHTGPQSSTWGSDEPRPLADSVLIMKGKRAVSVLALAYSALVRALRDLIDSASIAPEEAWERIDDVRAFGVLFNLTWRSYSENVARFRRAARLALADDPSEAAFLGRAYRALRRNAEKDWGIEYIASLDAALGGLISQFDEVANRVAAELSDVPTVYGRPVPPPPPEDRAVELALYRLALAHGRLRDTLARAATGGDGALTDPWPAVVAALETGAAEVDRALLAALDDPSPRYRPARALGLKWSNYDETVARLPLDTLSEDGRGGVVALANEVAAHARAVVAAVEAE